MMNRLLQMVSCAVGTTAMVGMLLLSGCATNSGGVFNYDAVGTPAPTPAPPPVAPVAPTTSSVASNSMVAPEGGVFFRVGDLITVKFSDTVEPPPPHEERIKDDGTITLPLIGSVRAVGKSPGELQKELHAAYVPKYYLRLTVTVTQSTELSYSVLGEIRVPGPKAYLGRTTVTQAIGAAGGLTDYASKTLQLTRANGTLIKVKYKKAISDPRLDPQVYPGDIINVPKSIW